MILRQQFTIVAHTILSFSFPNPTSGTTYAHLMENIIRDLSTRMLLSSARGNQQKKRKTDARGLSYIRGLWRLWPIMENQFLGNHGTDNNLIILECTIYDTTSRCTFHLIVLFHLIGATVQLLSKCQTVEIPVPLFRFE
ncbi:hypothetical protein BT69DRAFT_617446 [Atractiella rhizophila]|nr:hypothetical protein BT69DRAFT_617446 [Atractiella rhizophila]